MAASELEREFNIAVGKRLRALMKARGISERVAASRIGASNSSISNWKSGKNGLSFFRACQFAVLLNVQLEMLLPKGGFDGLQAKSKL